MSSGRLVVLCGLPGSGKTTLARALEASDDAVRLNSDEWIIALGLDLFDQDARARIEALQRALASDLLRAGCTVVAEWGVWSRAERDDLRALAASHGAAFDLRFLDVPVEELWRRVEARNAEPMFAARPITRAELDDWTTWIEPPGPDELGVRPVFDRVVVVDWSAESKPKTGKDSIWIRSLGPHDQHDVSENPPTRSAARQLLVRHLAAALMRGERVLAGFDFPLAYPAGTAAALGLDGEPWQAMWRLLRSEITDADDNTNNRFTVASSLNERMGVRRFWGCPAGKATPQLATTKTTADYATVAEWRATEVGLRGVQPVWKLYTAGSVGSQTLTGIPVLHALRSALGAMCVVWPFEPVPTGPCVVLAEVWPSQHPVAVPDGWVKDQAQVDALAGRLLPLTTLPEVPDVAREEGWILTP